MVIPMLRGATLPIDWISAAAVGLAAGLILMRFRKDFAAALQTLPVAVALLMPMILGYWIPSIDPHTSQQIDRLFGARTFVFFGLGVDLPLCFYLRSAIPYAENNDELMQLSTPGTVVIVPPAAARPRAICLAILNIATPSIRATAC